MSRSVSRCEARWDGSDAADLDWLLHPISPSDFFSTQWEQKPAFVGRRNFRYYSPLPQLDDVEELITATSSRSPEQSDDARIVRTDESGVLVARLVKTCKNGMPDIQDVFRAYEQGHTVVVNHLHRRNSRIARLCGSLEQAIHHRVGANLYLTPSNGQGLRPHFDTHDVFILQIHGTKEWLVDRPSKVLPLRDPPQDLQKLQEPEKFVLNAGDMLYIPRGFPHAATAFASSSMHLTVGVEVYRWVDLMIEALMVLADERVELRTALPLGFLQRRIDVSEMAALFEDLGHSLEAQSIVERAKARLGATLLATGKAGGGGHFRAIDASGALGLSSAVARAPEVRCRVFTRSEEATIEFDNNYVSAPLVAESSLRFIGDCDRFVVSDLPDDIADQDKLDLVRRLVAEGLLLVAETNDGGAV